jgi:hypothetical protein
MKNRKCPADPGAISSKKNNKFASYPLYAFFLLCLTPSVTSFASSSVRTVAHYKVSSLGLDIGDVTTTQRKSEEGGVPSVHFETRTAVKAPFLWIKYNLDTTEKGTILKHDLVSYSRKGRENDTAIDVEGRLENSSFRFDVREQGALRVIVIPRSSYDYTTMECPEAQLDFSGKTQITLRVLDVEKLAVVKREYRLVRTTHYTVVGKDYSCRIVDCLDQNKKARRWIGWDGTAVVLYRQDSRGEKPPYSVQATSVTREP